MGEQNDVKAQTVGPDKTNWGTKREFIFLARLDWFFTMTYEVEMKFALPDAASVAAFRQRIGALGARPGDPLDQRDIYFEIGRAHV